MTNFFLQVSLDPSSKGNALLLATNTEVSIAPKLRKAKPSATQKSHPNTAAGSSSQTDDTIGNKSTTPVSMKNAQILRLIPTRVLEVSFPQYSGSELLAYVARSTFNKLHPSHPILKDGETNIYFQHYWKRLPSPIDPNALPPPPPSSPSVPAPRVLKAGTTGNETTAEDKNMAEPSLYMGWMTGIPEGHIAFPLSTKEFEDWDLIQ